MEIRKKDHTILGPASSSYDDWKGTAVAETSMVKGSGDLYELAGLADERDRWTILAIDLDAHSHGADPRWSIYVYAADRQELGVQSYDDWAAVAAKHGGIPVVSILLHDATADDVIKCMKLVGFQLRSGHMPHDLLHAGYADFPEQE